MKEKISEIQLIKFLLTILENENEITLQNFIERIKEAFKLSDYDLSSSESRPNEAKYVQRCRSITCMGNLPKNIIYKNETFYIN